MRGRGDCGTSATGTSSGRPRLRPGVLTGQPRLEARGRGMRERRPAPPDGGEGRTGRPGIVDRRRKEVMREHVFVLVSN